MRRSVVTVILGVTVVLVGAVALWLLPVLTGWQPFWTTSARPVPVMPPSIPDGESPQSSELSPLAPTAKLTLTEVKAAWEPLAGAAQEGNWTAWSTIADADTGEVIFSSDTEAHTPASLLKLLTAYATLTVLEPEDRLTTGVSQLGDQLYLWGEGDLLLSAGRGNSKATNGHAGLADLAEEVAQNLNDPDATFTLNYQSELFAGETRSFEAYQQGRARWVGEIGPFAIDTGRVEPDEYDFYDESPLRVADALAALLVDEGIEVTKVVASGATVPEQATVVGEVQSAMVWEQVRLMLEVSDNTLAEQYCHLAATVREGSPASFETSTQNLMGVLQENGIDTQGLVIADCSGLNEDSRVSANTLLEVMRASLQPGAKASSLTRFLAIGGMSGTLEERFEDGLGFGNFVGKTGSLGHVSTLAGIGTTDSGQHIYVVVGADNVPEEGAWYVRSFVDDFVVRVLEN